MVGWSNTRQCSTTRREASPVADSMSVRCRTYSAGFAVAPTAGGGCRLAKQLRPLINRRGARWRLEHVRAQQDDPGRSDKGTGRSLAQRGVSARRFADPSVAGRRARGLRRTPARQRSMPRSYGAGMVLIRPYLLRHPGAVPAATVVWRIGMLGGVYLFALFLFAPLWGRHGQRVGACDRLRRIPGGRSRDGVGPESRLRLCRTSVGRRRCGGDVWRAGSGWTSLCPPQV